MSNDVEKGNGLTVNTVFQVTNIPNRVAADKKGYSGEIYLYRHGAADFDPIT